MYNKEPRYMRSAYEKEPRYTLEGEPGVLRGPLIFAFITFVTVGGIYLIIKYADFIDNFIQTMI